MRERRLHDLAQARYAEEAGRVQDDVDDDELYKGKKKTNKWDLSTILKYGSVSLISILIGTVLGFLEFNFLDHLKESSLTWYVKYKWTVKAREFKSIAEGLAKSPTQPFIVRNAPEFAYLTLEYALEEMEKHPEWTTMGNNPEGNTESREVSRLIQEFQSDTLDLFVFDSPLEMFDMPEAMLASHVKTENEDAADSGYIPLQQGLVLSRIDSVTSWHIDPPIKGGGWMYLWQGTKDWKLLDPWLAPFFYTSYEGFKYHIIDLNEADYDKVVKLPSSLELAKLCNAFKHGAFRFTPFQTVTARAGDFVYFPPGWLHRVETKEKALGLGILYMYIYIDRYMYS